MNTYQAIFVLILALVPTIYGASYWFAPSEWVNKDWYFFSTGLSFIIGGSTILYFISAYISGWVLHYYNYLGGLG